MENAPKIENNNILDNSRRFESLEEEMLDYQFQYIEKLQEGVLKPLHEKVEGYEETFLDYISEYTSIRQYLTEKYCKMMGDNMYKNEEERKKFNEWYDSVINEIVLSHDIDNKNYRNKISEIFKSGFDKLIPISEKENEYLLDENTKNMACLIHFNTTKAMDEFKEFGINEGDNCISIHFKDLIKQKNKDGSVINIFSNESLSELALKIIEKYPETKAIIAQSWIVDSAIGQRIGLIPSKKINNVVQDSRFWGQFIDQKGKIKKNEMQKFLDTGIPEHYVTDGFIMTDDFLKKYLPKEYKGKIIKLKDITEESRNFNKEFTLLSKEFNEKWENSSYEEIVEIINKNETIADYFRTEDGQDYLKIIKKVKKQNLDRQSANKIDFKNNNEIKKKFDNFIKEKGSQYVEREVFIP